MKSKIASIGNEQARWSNPLARAALNPTLLTGLATLLMQALTIFSGALTARLLGVEGRGAFAACTLAPMFFAAMGDLGGPIATAYLSAVDRRLSNALARNAVMALVVASPLLIAFSVIATPFFLTGHNSLAFAASLFALIYVPVQFLGRHLNAIYQGRGDFLAFNISRLASPALNCIVLLFLTFQDKPSIPMVLAAPAIGSIVFMIATLPNLARAWSTRPFIDVQLLKHTYTYGAKAQLGAMSPIETFRLDLALVLLFLSTFDAGLYAVAIAAAGLLRAQAATIGLVAVPTIARQKDQASKVRIASLYFTVTLALLALASVVLLAIANPLISLIYGAEFSAAVPILRILVLAMIFAAMRQALGDSLRGMGYPGIGSLAEVVAWISVAATLPILVPLYGASGAAASVAISYFCAFVGTMILMHTKRLPLWAVVSPRYAINELRCKINPSLKSSRP